MITRILSWVDDNNLLLFNQISSRAHGHSQTTSPSTHGTLTYHASFSSLQTSSHVHGIGLARIWKGRMIIVYLSEIRVVSLKTKVLWYATSANTWHTYNAWPTWGDIVIVEIFMIHGLIPWMTVTHSVMLSTTLIDIGSSIHRNSISHLKSIVLIKDWRWVESVVSIRLIIAVIRAPTLVLLGFYAW